MIAKWFTLEEANALLPELKQDLLQLQELVRQLEQKYVTLQQQKADDRPTQADASGQQDPFFEQEGELEFLRMEAKLLAGNFDRKGVLLKMIDPGLIDFPAILNGQEILICWKEGEERATHYHGWNDGFIGRKPFPGELD